MNGMAIRETEGEREDRRRERDTSLFAQWCTEPEMRYILCAYLYAIQQI